MLIKQWDYYKTHQSFKRQPLVLQIAATLITHCGSFYYKIRQLLKNRTFITKGDITKLTWNTFSV